MPADSQRRRGAARAYDEDNVSPLHGVALVTDLPERLRLQTRDLHILSERSGVMADLLGRRLGAQAYCALLRNLHAIYAALEDALSDAQQVSWLSAADLADLRRERAIAADLDTLHGPDWRSALTLLPATVSYVQRLQGAASRLPAHAYVRYLGDLHGGQMLKRLIAQNLGLAPQAVAASTNFYEFGDETRVHALRAKLRQGLAAMEVSEPLAEQLVAEARWAFEQHILLFEQLAAESRAAPSTLSA